MKYMGEIKGFITESEYRKIMTKTHLTMSELEVLGFKIIKSYVHDEWTAQRRVKGCISIETTYHIKTGNFETQEIKIDDGEWRVINPNELKILDKILNKKNEK